MSLQELLFKDIDLWRTLPLTVIAFIVLMLYLTGNAIYQLHFSPLAKFPGPRLAAATLWFEIYYDVFKWGKYYVEIEKMHKQYGK